MKVPLDGGATASVVGGSVADDPWSLEVMDLPTGARAGAQRSS